MCNKKCQYCSHRIQTSDYKYLKPEEFKYIVSCIKKPREIVHVNVVGGEPLCHPHFNWLMKKMLTVFPNARIRVLTNGKLLPTVNKKIFNKLDFQISEYPSWNDEIIREYRKYPNVKIEKFEGFWNPNIDPNLDEKTAKEIRKKCYFGITILGTKMYGCCGSEGIERAYKTEPVHIKFDASWKENLSKLPT
ncbi:MAG: radical SAM protein, partial [Candidatus Hodarchaeota archaeon]